MKTSIFFILLVAGLSTSCEYYRTSSDENTIRRLEEADIAAVPETATESQSTETSQDVVLKQLQEQQAQYEEQLAQIKSTYETANAEERAKFDAERKALEERIAELEKKEAEIKEPAEPPAAEVEPAPEVIPPSEEKPKYEIANMPLIKDSLASELASEDGTFAKGSGEVCLFQNVGNRFDGGLYHWCLGTDGNTREGVSKEVKSLFPPSIIYNPVKETLDLFYIDLVENEYRLLHRTATSDPNRPWGNSEILGGALRYPFYASPAAPIAVFDPKSSDVYVFVTDHEGYLTRLKWDHAKKDDPTTHGWGDPIEIAAGRHSHPAGQKRISQMPITGDPAVVENPFSHTIEVFVRGDQTSCGWQLCNAGLPKYPLLRYSSADNFSTQARLGKDTTQIFGPPVAVVDRKNRKVAVFAYPYREDKDGKAIPLQPAFPDYLVDTYYWLSNEATGWGDGQEAVTRLPYVGAGLTTPTFASLTNPANGNMMLFFPGPYQSRGSRVYEGTVTSMDTKKIGSNFFGGSQPAAVYNPATDKVQTFVVLGNDFYILEGGNPFALDPNCNPAVSADACRTNWGDDQVTGGETYYPGVSSKQVHTSISLGTAKPIVVFNGWTPAWPFNKAAGL